MDGKTYQVCPVASLLEDNRVSFFFVNGAMQRPIDIVTNASPVVMRDLSMGSSY